MNKVAATTIRLREADRATLQRHFTSLDNEDRRLRFGTRVADEVITSYVERLDFEHDGLFAVQDESLELVAVVHVALSGTSAELGLSVIPRSRGKGLGNALFRRAVTFLRNRGAMEVLVHCLRENGAMMHLARKSGMRIVYADQPTRAATAFAKTCVDADPPRSFVSSRSSSMV